MTYRHTCLLDRYDGDELTNGDLKPRKTEVMPSVGGGLRCMVSRSASRDSQSSAGGSAKAREEVSPRKRKIVQKHKGAPKKQKASMIKAAADLKRIAGGGANLPPSQRYNFYRNYGKFSSLFTS